MPYWLITTGPDPSPGINGGLMPRQHPQQPCVNTVSVTNLDETLAAAVANGGKVALPKMPVPGSAGSPTSTTRKATSSA